MKRLLPLVIALALVFVMAANAQTQPLSNTFTSGHDLFSIDYPTDWEAFEVGPNLYWFASPGAEVINQVVPAGDALIVVRLPAQNNLLPPGYTTNTGDPITVGDRSARWYIPGGNDGLQRRTIIFQYPDGWLDITLIANPGDIAGYEPLLVAMAESAEYNFADAPTPTPRPTIPVPPTPTPAPTLPPTMTPTPRDLAQTITNLQQTFEISVPQGWVSDLSFMNHVYVGSSEEALEGAIYGEEILEGEFAIRAFPSFRRGAVNENFLDLRGIITNPTLYVTSYNDLSYPAYLFDVYATVNEERMPNELTVIMADIDGRVTFFAVYTEGRFSDHQADVNAILNSARYLGN